MRKNQASKQEEQTPRGFITLREASSISGYAPDYIGQLIRKGKLYGKQVSYNVAWVTTKDALLDYLEHGREEKEGSDHGWRRKLANAAVVEELGLRIERYIAVMGVFLFGAFALFLMYVFSVQIDQLLARRAADARTPDTELEPGAFYTSQSP
jgi:hypothetical protein